MITYLNQIKETRTARCSLEIWQKLTTSAMTKQCIEMFRKTGMIDWKQRLPAVNFHGYDPKVLKGMAGSRKQADLLPTGLFMLDVDHIDNPKKIWEKLKKTLLKEEIQMSLALVHITPSGKGIRIVMKGREGSTIKDDQKFLADLLGVQHDECTKDLSRWSFIPMKSDILYQNNQILFADAEETSYNQTKESLSGGMDGGKDSFSRYDSPQTPDAHTELNSESDSTSGKFPETYRGIPYSKIVEALIQYHGGTPEMGERHARIITLANDLRFITDSNVDWLLQLVPNFDKPNYEKREAIVWCVQHNSLRKTKALSAVLDWLQNGKPFSVEHSREDDLLDIEDEEEKRKAAAIESIPQMPKKLPRLVDLLTSKVMDFQKPALSQMIFPPLAAHVPEALFVGRANQKFELSLMGVVVGTQSVGKGCIDDPIDVIMSDIAADDAIAEEELAAYDLWETTKSANEKGKEKPTKPIRILETNTSFAALLISFKNAEKGGYAKNLCCFTKSAEIEQLYDMGLTNGRNKISQLIKDTYDRARIGSGRATAIATKGHAALRWNWCASTTPHVAKNFFKKVLHDGTLSRVDFCAMIAPPDNGEHDDDDDFIYGTYNDAFYDAIEPYIENLRNYRGQWDKRGNLIPEMIPNRLLELEMHMNKYIKQYSRTMVDDTWKNFAWRTKMNALKKIIVLYIANGGKWEEEFEPFCWWCFHYSMWVKMNLFYEKASEAFADESIVANVSIASPLDLVGEEFTRQELYDAIKQSGRKSPGHSLLKYYENSGSIIRTEGRDKFKKSK